jgi:hypothetical protein
MSGDIGGHLEFHAQNHRAALASARRDGMMLPVEASIQVHEEAACGPCSTCPVCAFRIAAERRGMERAAEIIEAEVARNKAKAYEFDRPVDYDEVIRWHAQSKAVRHCLYLVRAAQKENP